MCIDEDMTLSKIWPMYEITGEEFRNSDWIVYKAVRSDIDDDCESLIWSASFSQDTGGEHSEQSVAYRLKLYRRGLRFLNMLRGYTNILCCEDYSICRDDSQSHVHHIYVRTGMAKCLPLRLQMGAFREEDIIDLGIDITRAMEVCMKKGIVHQNIKPDKIFIDPDGNYRLGCFENAFYEGEQTSDMIHGTPLYMAPEEIQMRMERYDLENTSKADIYSLGMVMYYLANDRKIPFVTRNRLLTQIEMRNALETRLTGRTIPPLQGIHPELCRIILKACAFRKEDRFESTEEMRSELLCLKNKARNT